MKFDKWGVGMIDNWNNSYIYIISLKIQIKVGTLSISTCNGFSFLVHIWGKLQIHVLKSLKK